jgi:hypothetical protein
MNAGDSEVAARSDAKPRHAANSIGSGNGTNHFVRSVFNLRGYFENCSGGSRLGAH